MLGLMFIPGIMLVVLRYVFSSSLFPFLVVLRLISLVEGDSMQYANFEWQNPSTWQISWGWDYKGDFAVVTVKNDPNQYEAFFGYEHPNAGGPTFKYADETNKVQPVSK